MYDVYMLLFDGTQYQPSGVFRNRDTASSSISYCRKGVFHANFTANAPEFLISPGIQG